MRFEQEPVPKQYNILAGKIHLVEELLTTIQDDKLPIVKRLRSFQEKFEKFRPTLEKSRDNRTKRFFKAVMDILTLGHFSDWLKSRTQSVKATKRIHTLFQPLATTVLGKKPDKKTRKPR
jgi:hypothetical protein